MSESIFKLLDLGEKIEKKFGSLIAIAFISIVIITILAITISITLPTIFSIMDVIGAKLFGANYIGLFN